MGPDEFNFSLLHIGINTSGTEEGYSIAKLLCDHFGMRETGSAIFVNEQFEVMKMPFRGRLGHIAIATSNILEARNYLESKGLAFDDDSAVMDASGNLRLIYTKNDIAGFAFHLTQKS